MPLNLDDPALLPPTLADTGAFSDLIELTPAPGIIAYEVNVPLWSDGAHKQRFFCLHDADMTIGFEREVPWSFPIGAVWVKHFELGSGAWDLPGRRIETRFLVRATDGVYGVTYRWDDSQTNATLVASEGLEEDIDVQENGETHTQVWHYPSRKECLTCHTQAGGWALGFNTWQLNRDVSYGGINTNQIAALSQAGYFSTNITGIHTLRALAAATNSAWSLEYRVRSYLAANCAQCHQPGTDCLAKWDARITSPTAAARIINAPLTFPSRDPGDRVIVPGSLPHSMMFQRISNLDSFHMPPIATTVLNKEALNLLSAWITSGLANYKSFADWQLSFFGSTSFPGAAADADPDGDGAVNQLEYLVGSNPLLSGESWNIGIQTDGATVQIGFSRLANRALEVQWTTDLQDPKSWTALDQPDNRPFFSSANGSVVLEDPISLSVRKFYRVRIYEP